MTFDVLGKAYRIDKRGIWRWNPVQGDSDNENLILSWEFVRYCMKIALVLAIFFIFAYFKYTSCMEIFDNFWHCALQK